MLYHNLETSSACIDLWSGNIFSYQYNYNIFNEKFIVANLVLLSQTQYIKYL